VFIKKGEKKFRSSFDALGGDGRGSYNPQQLASLVSSAAEEEQAFVLDATCIRPLMRLVRTAYVHITVCCAPSLLLTYPPSSCASRQMLFPRAFISPFFLSRDNGGGGGDEI
jgi:hypothetical protein